MQCCWSIAKQEIRAFQKSCMPGMRLQSRVAGTRRVEWAYWSTRSKHFTVYRITTQSMLHKFTLQSPSPYKQQLLYSSDWQLREHWSSLRLTGFAMYLSTVKITPFLGVFFCFLEIDGKNIHVFFKCEKCFFGNCGTEWRLGDEEKKSTPKIGHFDYESYGEIGCHPREEWCSIWLDVLLDVIQSVRQQYYYFVASYYVGTTWSGYLSSVLDPWRSDLRGYPVKI